MSSNETSNPRLKTECTSDRSSEALTPHLTGFTLPPPYCLNSTLFRDFRYPFVCSLRHRQTKKHFCGGSLIRKNVVLTAAHCVDHRDANIIRPIVHIGRYHRSQNSQDYEEIKTKKTIIHPHWDPDSNANDLALIFLEKDSSYQPIALKGG